MSNLVNLLCLGGLVLSFSAMSKEKYIFSTHLNKPVSDLLNERLAEACLAVKLNCEVRLMPGNRALSAADLGEIDGDASRREDIKELSPENTKNLIQVKETSLEDDMVLVTRESTKVSEINWSNINKLKLIAFIRGAKMIEKNVAPHNQLPSGDVPSMFNTLIEGRVEGLIIVKSVVSSYILENKIQGLKIHPKMIVKNRLFPWVHSSNKDLVAKLEKGLRIIKKNGKYNKIGDKFLNSK